MAFPSLRTAFAKFFLAATGAHVPSTRTFACRYIFLYIFLYIILNINSGVLIMH